MLHNRTKSRFNDAYNMYAKEWIEITESDVEPEKVAA